MVNIFKLRYLFMLFILINASILEAAWWNPLSWIPKRDARRVETLIITGNFVKSRILAELIQRETKQPILLLPSGNEKGSMFFLTPLDDTLEVRKNDFLKFIDFLQPKRIMILGNESYAPRQYADMVKDQVPIWSVTNDDWEKIAFSVGDFLKLKHLGYDYLVLLNQLDAQGNIKPPASTDVFGGYKTKGRYWTPED